MKPGRKPKPLPDDFAATYAQIGVAKCARRYGVAENTIKRWIGEAGVPRRPRTVAKPKPEKAPKPLRPAPEEFARLAPQLGLKKSCDHFRAGSDTIKRWAAEAGIVVLGKSGPKPAPRAAKPAPAAPAPQRPAVVARAAFTPATVTQPPAHYDRVKHVLPPVRTMFEAR